MTGADPRGEISSRNEAPAPSEVIVEAPLMSDENTPVELILHIVRRIADGQDALRDDLNARIDALQEHTDRRLAVHDRRFDELKAHQDVVALALSQIGAELTRIHARLDAIERRGDVVDERLDRLDRRADLTDARLDRLEPRPR